MAFLDPDHTLAWHIEEHLLPLAALYAILTAPLTDTSDISCSSGHCSEASKGQSSMRKGLHGASRMEIQLQGDSSAPQGTGQASKPPAAPMQQPAVAPPIAAFRGDSPQPEPEGGMLDVDMEEL